MRTPTRLDHRRPAADHIRRQRPQHGVPRLGTQGGQAPLTAATGRTNLQKWPTKSRPAEPVQAYTFGSLVLAPAALVLLPALALAFRSGEKDEAYEWMQHRVAGLCFAAAFASRCWADVGAKAG